ncbi:MAG: putative toxin-antitoxin system toxin component, PIN family [Nitrospirota bacterium]|nr:putative toxin-antitoxin system toxin component, PIN family [Nitrospirota bacterium]
MAGKKLRIILDTNVLYAGLYSSRGASFKVLRAIADGKMRGVLSTALLFEYEDVLKRNQEILNLSNRAIEKVLGNLCFLSDHQKIYFLWRPRLSDPKDDHLLELAVAAGVKFVVTHNTSDFKGSDKFGVRAITPKELLEEIV